FRSHHPDYADGGQLRDFVYVKDAAKVAAWLVERDEVGGVFNLGTGQARSFKDLAEAVFAASGKALAVGYVDTPESISGQYQYFTEAKMQRLRALGYTAPFASLEEGIADYVKLYRAQSDPYR
ncbi:MAG: NAD-dependent epimerase/dehydratase family protein, partial [Pseudomonadota bacterium]|nr:NAD-dependent epimerase/dehydratase family protein [Pseudomonadota bacterium]